MNPARPASIVERGELRLLAVRAEGFPEGIPGAFESLEGRLPTLRGRRFYGATFGGPDGLEYFAGVVPQDEGEAKRLGLRTISVSAGAWARAKVLGWQERSGEIPSVVDEMIERYGIDPTRPVLEYYRSSEELHLLVPVVRK